MNQIPIKNVKGIHYEQIIARLVTLPAAHIKNSPELKKTIIKDSLKIAEVELIQVQVTRPNQAKTALVIDGIKVDVHGNPLEGVEPKNLLVEGVELPFDQENVNIQPGTYFDDIEVAKSIASAINVKTVETIEIVKKKITEISDHCMDIIEKQ